jgi:iron complex outermembrane receptor protein
MMFGPSRDTDRRGEVSLSKFRHGTAAAAFIVAGFYAQHAFALTSHVDQPAGGTPGTTASSADQVQAASEPAEARGADPGDIVVTARRRAESLQKVPTAITAVGAEMMDERAVVDIRGLNGLIPNVNFQRGTTSSSTAQIFLRGVGIDNTAFNVDPNVAIYLDDIFIGRLVASMIGALDFERVEVLRGPQGTLYGRNATAGAVKYVTVKPNLNESGAKLAVTLGNFDRRTFRGSANLVLDPGRLALLLSAQTRDEDGYMKLYDNAGAYTGKKGNATHSQDYRVAMRWQPDDLLTVDAAIDYSRNRSGLAVLTPTNCASLGLVPGITGAGTPGLINAGQLNRCPLYYPGSPYKSYASAFAYDLPKTDSGGAAVTASYDLGFATLKSSTGYRGFTDNFVSSLYGKPPPFLQVDLFNKLYQRQFQQELQLSSASKSWYDYTVGLFYFYEKTKSDYFTSAGVPPAVSRFWNRDRQDANSYAMFGEVYLRPIDNLEITLGGRYSIDHKSVDREIFLNVPYDAPDSAFETPSITYNDKIRTKRFTPKVGISYDTGPVLLYATYSEGYRTAGWALGSPSNLSGAASEFGIESETSYEAGYKATLFDNLLTWNTSVFSAKYNNQQATLTLTTGQTIVVTADVKIKGLESEVRLRPAQGLSIFGNVGLLRGRYSEPPAGQPYAKFLKNAPPVNATVGADYSTSLSTLPGNFFAGADASYTKATHRNVANTIDQKSPAFTIVNARLGYRSENDHWSLTLNAANLTDKVYYLLGTQNQARSYQPGRRVFVTGEIKF